MEKRKLISVFVLISLLSFSLFAKEKERKVVASTSWVAAFAELAGVEDVTVIAPPSLSHPPEYEITVNDVLNITSSDYFIYAGFERMMKTLQSSLSSSNTTSISIKLNNSLATVKESTLKIANMLGTEKICRERISEYEKVLKEGNKKIEEKGMKGAKVLCHTHQIFLAKELGLNVVDTFGPGEISSSDLINAKNKDYDFIIDNIHNPVGKPLTEVSSAKYIVWRNFPETVGDNSLIKMVIENIEKITK